MIAAIFAYSSMGMETARRVRQGLSGMQTHCFAPQRLADGDFEGIPKPSQSFYGEWFSQAEVLIFVGSCGIAVRQIAPYVYSKTRRCCVWTSLGSSLSRCSPVTLAEPMPWQGNCLKNWEPQR